MIKKICTQYIWQIAIAVPALLNWCGIPILPPDSGPVTGWLFASDMWITNHGMSITLTMALTSAFIGLVLVPNVEAATRFYASRKPKLRLSFADDDACIHFAYTETIAPLRNFMPGEPITRYATLESGNYYVRLCVENAGSIPAKNVTAQLMKVQMLKGGRYEDAPYFESIRLGKNDFDLAGGEKCYVDVFYINQHEEQVTLGATLFSHAGIVHEPGMYKLDIQLSAESCKISPMSLIFDWRGEYERPRVSLGNGRVQAVAAQKPTEEIIAVPQEQDEFAAAVASVPAVA